MPYRKNNARQHGVNPLSPRQTRVLDECRFFTEAAGMKTCCGFLAALDKSLRPGTDAALLHRRQNQQ
jgi:hypothetical protein